MKPRLSDPPPVAHTLPRPQPPVKSADYRQNSTAMPTPRPAAWPTERRFPGAAYALKLWPFGR